MSPGYVAICELEYILYGVYQFEYIYHLQVLVARAELCVEGATASVVSTHR